MTIKNTSNTNNIHPNITLSESSVHLGEIEEYTNELHLLLDYEAEKDRPTKEEITRRAYVLQLNADDLILLLNEFKEQMQQNNFSRINRMGLFDALCDEFVEEFRVLNIRSKEIYPEYFIEPERDHLKK